MSATPRPAHSSPRSAPNLAVHRAATSNPTDQVARGRRARRSAERHGNGRVRPVRTDDACSNGWRAMFTRPGSQRVLRCFARRRAPPSLDARVGAECRRRVRTETDFQNRRSGGLDGRMPGQHEPMRRVPRNEHQPKSARSRPGPNRRRSRRRVLRNEPRWRCVRRSSGMPYGLLRASRRCSVSACRSASACRNRSIPASSSVLTPAWTRCGPNPKSTSVQIPGTSTELRAAPPTQRTSTVG